MKQDRATCAMGCAGGVGADGVASLACFYGRRGLPDRVWRDVGSRCTPRRSADRGTTAARAVAAYPLRRAARSLFERARAGRCGRHAGSHRLVPAGRRRSSAFRVCDRPRSRKRRAGRAHHRELGVAETRPTVSAGESSRPERCEVGGDAAPGGAGRLVDRDAIRTRRRSHATRRRSALELRSPQRLAVGRAAARDTARCHSGPPRRCWESRRSGFRSNDVLAFVRWTLPPLVQIFPQFPERLLIVSGPDSMWRGGLSGSGSIYLHADRPLISQNGTSTPLHEMVHVASGLHGSGGADWIVEGIAEYYSLDVLHRSNTISDQRCQASFDTLAKWSAGNKCVATDRSEGAQTAYAVGAMHALTGRSARRRTTGSRWTIWPAPYRRRMYRLPTRAPTRQQPN